MFSCGHHRRCCPFLADVAVGIFVVAVGGRDCNDEGAHDDDDDDDDDGDDGDDDGGGDGDGNGNDDDDDDDNEVHEHGHDHDCHGVLACFHCT